MPRPKPDLAVGPTKGDEHAAFQQPLEIEQQIIVGIAQLLDKGEDLLQGFAPLPLEIAEPALPSGNQEPVDGGVTLDDAGRCFFHQPGDSGIREVAAQDVEGRQGVGYISDGGGLDNQNIHNWACWSFVTVPAG